MASVFPLVAFFFHPEKGNYPKEGTVRSFWVQMIRSSPGEDHLHTAYTCLKGKSEAASHQAQL